MSAIGFSHTDFRCLECGSCLMLNFLDRTLKHGVYPWVSPGAPSTCSQEAKTFQLPTFELEEIPAPTAADFLGGVPA